MLSKHLRSTPEIAALAPNLGGGILGHRPDLATGVIISRNGGGRGRGGDLMCRYIRSSFCKLQQRCTWTCLTYTVVGGWSGDWWQGRQLFYHHVRLYLRLLRAAASRSLASGGLGQSDGPRKRATLVDFTPVRVR